MPQQQQLSNAIDAYLASRKANGRKANTLRSERGVLLQFLTLTGNIYLSSITPQHVDKLFASKADRWGSGAMNLARCHLNTFFRFCRAHRWMQRDNDPMMHTTNRRVAREPRMRVPVGEFQRLLDCAAQPRDRMIVALGLFLFLRGSEIRLLRVGDIHLDRDEITVHVEKSTIIDNMPISKPLRRELNRYLTYYTETVGLLSPATFLIPAYKPRPGIYNPTTGKLENLSTPTVTTLRPDHPVLKPELPVQRTLEAAGYPTFKEGVHTLRRSGARALFDELCERGYDRALEIVSTMLHHKEMGTTQIYLGLTESQHRRDALLKGQPMFSGMEHDNVIQLHPEAEDGTGPSSA